METTKHASHTRALLTQAQNNTTLWIGHLLSDPVDHFAGQTFICNTSGRLDNIQVLASAIQIPGEVTLNLHSFYPEKKNWGSLLGTAKATVQKNDQSKWIRFDLPPVELKAEESYGFRLQASGAMVAIGEAASGATEPFFYGQEWEADSKDRTGHFYSYFSLAFKIELCA